MLRLRSALDGQLRTATLFGVEHLVVPVVALKEGVIWPMNSPTKELVLEEELAAAPDGWKGRPVVNDHPIRGQGQAVSANEPEILETERFGYVFHPRVERKRLLLEAWLDPLAAAKVGNRALRVIERINNHEDVEISVGVFVDVDETPGTYQGESYHAIWRGIVPDHLALLSEDSIGACSVDMGCGAPRDAVARQEDLNVEEDAMPVIRTARMPTEVAKPASWFSKLKELIAQSNKEKKTVEEPTIRLNAMSADMSDNDLRRDLERELRATVPGYMGIEAVFPTENMVYFSAMPREEWVYYGQEFTVRGGTTKLKGDLFEVEPVTRFEPLDAGVTVTATLTAAATCGCQTKENATMAVETKRLDALMKKLGIADRHRSTLDQMNDAQITALETAEPEEQAGSGRLPNQPARNPDGTPVTQQPDSAAVPPGEGGNAVPPASSPGRPTGTPSTTPPTTTAAKTSEEYEEEWLATAPPSIRGLVNGMKDRDKARRSQLVDQLKTLQRQFTEAELQKMPIDQLEKTAALLKVESLTVDFSGLGVPRVNEGADDRIDPPPSMFDAVKALHAKK